MADGSLESSSLGSAGSEGVSVVLCHYLLSLPELKKVLVLLGQCGADRIVVVGNRKDSAVIEPQASNISFVGGSNSLYDFSAYSEGLHVLQPATSGGVLFINDSLFRKYPFRWVIKKVMKDISLYRDVCGPLAVGLSGSYQFYLSSNPWSGAARHLCTACFYLNATASRLLLQLVETSLTFLSSASELATREELDFRMRSFFGDRFFGYLTLLHFREATRVWARELADPRDKSATLKKAICFYLEHRLSGEIENRGGGLIFINRGRDKVKFRVLLALSRALYGTQRRVARR